MHCVRFPPKSSHITPGVLVALPICRNTIRQQVDKGTWLIHDQSQYQKDAVMLSLTFCEAVDHSETVTWTR